MKIVGMGSQPAQNKAHRKDLMWIKIGKKPSEYMRSDGVTIQKDQARRDWVVKLPGGEIAAKPRMTAPFGVYETLPARAYSLTEAKYIAEQITVNTPAVNK